MPELTFEIKCRLFTNGHRSQADPLPSSWSFILVDFYFKSVGVKYIQVLHRHDLVTGREFQWTRPDIHQLCTGKSIMPEECSPDKRLGFDLSRPLQSLEIELLVTSMLIHNKQIVRPSPLLA